MANRQIAGLTARTLALTDLIPTQDAAGAVEAGKNTITQLKTALALAKGDVGLGNVDNTSDANKPVSTAQGAAIGAKQNSLGFTAEDVANKSTNVTTDGASDTKYPSVKSVKTYVDANAGVLPFKIFAFTLSQVSTGTPTLRVISNTTGGTAVVARVAAGQYTITSSTLAQMFPNTKTFVGGAMMLGGAGSNGNNGGIPIVFQTSGLTVAAYVTFQISGVTGTEITMFVFGSGGVTIDLSVLFGSAIEFPVQVFIYN